MDQSQDASIRLAAVEQLKRVAVAGIVTADDLKVGILIDSVRVPLINPQRGIFKPAAMLSASEPCAREAVGRYDTTINAMCISTSRKGYYPQGKRW